LEGSLSPKTDAEYIHYYAIACIHTASSGVSNKHTDNEFPNLTTLPGWITSNNWLTNSSYCTWYGIACKNGLVDKIELFENRMYGTFAPEVQLLADSVTVIDLFDNFFLTTEGDAGNGWIAKMVNLVQLLFGSTSFEYPGVAPYINKLPKLSKLIEANLNGYLPFNHNNIHLIRFSCRGT